MVLICPQHWLTGLYQPPGRASSTDQMPQPLICNAVQMYCINRDQPMLEGESKLRTKIYGGAVLCRIGIDFSWILKDVKTRIINLSSRIPMLPTFLSQRKIRWPRWSAIIPKRHPHLPKPQTLKFISLSAFLIIGSITAFSVAATFLAIKPLDFTAPNALPIRAQVSV